MMNLTRWLVAVMLAVIMVPGAALGRTTYYVSATGDDAHEGTSAEKAFKTISKAAALTRPGDSVLIAPGKYVERVKITTSGTAELPISFSRDGVGEVVLTTPEPDPERFQDQYAFQIEGQSYICITGITFRDCKAWIVLWDSHHCRITGCTFDGARTYNCLRINNGTFNRISSCKFLRAREQTGFRENEPWIPVPGADYIEIFRGSHNNLVEDCTFGRITHTAVSISAVEEGKFWPTRNVVRGNRFVDPGWKCNWIHAGRHNVFEQNVCAGTSAGFVQLESGTSIIRRNQFLHYRDSTGAKPDITLRGAVRMQFDYAQGNRIYHNTFCGNERTLTNNSFRWHVTDNVFKNNIFYHNAQTVFLGFPDYRTKNRNYFHGNLMVGTKPGEKIIALDKDNYTLAEAQEKMPELYKGNIEGDPGFDTEKRGAAGEGDLGNFTLRGKVCIDAGMDLTVTAAEGQGTEIPVRDSLYFSDGNGLVEGDRIVIGRSGELRRRGGDDERRIIKVDYERHVLTVDRPITWKAGEAVNLAYLGKGPDIGYWELDRGEP